MKSTIGHRFQRRSDDGRRVCLPKSKQCWRVIKGDGFVSEPFYILSVDGGGFRGLIAAHLLKRIEETWQIDCLRRFGLLADTFTSLRIFL